MRHARLGQHSYPDLYRLVGTAAHALLHVPTSDPDGPVLVTQFCEKFTPDEVNESSSPVLAVGRDRDRLRESPELLKVCHNEIGIELNEINVARDVARAFSVPIVSVDRASELKDGLVETVGCGRRVGVGPSRSRTISRVRAPPALATSKPRSVRVRFFSIAIGDVAHEPR